MKLFLVRHAQSQGNATGDYSTQAHDSLTELGKQQAQKLADALEAIPFDHCLVSPLGRTLETISPFLERSDRRAEVWTELAEGCWQEDLGERAEDYPTIEHGLPEGLPERFELPPGPFVRPADHETFAHGHYRVRRSLERLLALRQSKQCVLLVSHGHFLAQLLNRFLGTAAHHGLDHDNTGVSLLELMDRPLLHYLNRSTEGTLWRKPIVH